MYYYIDFETRSKVDIKMGVHAYATHPSTQVICASIVDSVMTTPLKFNMLSNEGVASFVEFVASREKTDVWRAHNASFERTIWRNVLWARNPGTPSLPEYWECSAERASACGLPPKLEGAAKALGLTVQKDMEGHSLMKRMCKPRKPRKGEDPTATLWHETPEQIARLMQYCDIDVLTDRELFKVLPAFSPIQQKMSDLTYQLNCYGVGIDYDFVKKAVSLISETEEQLHQKTQRITNGYVSKMTERDSVKRWCEAQGVTLLDFKASTARGLAACDTVPAVVRELLEIKDQIGKISVKKYRALNGSVVQTGALGPRAFDVLRHNAGMTGRWGGTNVQFHNIPRGHVENTDQAIDFIKKTDADSVRLIYGQNLQDTLSSCLRGVIVARPGCKLLVGDYKNIEARILPWLSGDGEMVARYARGEDMYVYMARVIYGKEKVSKDERQLGKKTVLGCGYGMGWKRFKESCRLEGMVISDELAMRAVKTWRSENYKSTRYWYQLDREAKETIRTGNPHGCFSMMEINHVPTMTCKLPSGRLLYYVDPKVVDDQLSYMCMNEKKQWIRADIWGGTLTENIDQATGYDLLAQGCLNLFARGYRLVLTVHDEAICEVRKDGKLKGVQLEGIRYANKKIFGDEVEQKLVEHYDQGQCLSTFLKHLTSVPAWGKGIPVAADGWEGVRYKKER